MHLPNPTSHFDRQVSYPRVSSYVSTNPVMMLFLLMQFWIGRIGVVISAHLITESFCPFHVTHHAWRKPSVTHGLSVLCRVTVLNGQHISNKWSTVSWKNVNCSSHVGSVYKYSHLICARVEVNNALSVLPMRLVTHVTDFQKSPFRSVERHGV